MTLERVPPITLESKESIEHIYDFFEQRGPVSVLTKAVYPLLAVILSPTRSFELGAEERLSDHLQNGGKIFMALKHGHELDPVQVAGATFRGPLRQMREGSDIMAKPGLFMNQRFAQLLTFLGAYAGIRGKDFDYEKFNAPTDELLRSELQTYAARRAIELGTIRLNRDNHQGIFFEGERTQEEVTIRRVKRGIGEILTDADNPEKFLLVCAAVDYTLGLCDATVAFSYPQQIPAKAEEIKQLAATDTRRCVEAAAWLSASRRPNPKGQVMNRLLSRFLPEEYVYPNRET